MLNIRSATRADADTIASLVRELADYEKLLHEARATGEDFLRELEADNPVIRVLIAEWDGQPAGFALTFLAVVAAMVLFRAPDLASAGNILGGMVGLNGIGLPGNRFGASAMHLIDGVVPAHVFATGAATLLALLAIALLLPNSVQILSAYEPVLYTPKRPAEMLGVLPPALRRPLHWRPTVAWMVLFAAIAAVSMIRLTGRSEFLYWQF